MADAETLRQNARDMISRLLAAGEDDLAERLIHPDFVNHEADPERRAGPAGVIATGRWLRSCFGELSYEFNSVLVEGDMAAAFAILAHGDELLWFDPHPLPHPLHQ